MDIFINRAYPFRPGSSLNGKLIAVMAIYGMVFLQVLPCLRIYTRTTLSSWYIHVGSLRGVCPAAACFNWKHRGLQGFQEPGATADSNNSLTCGVGSSAYRKNRLAKEPLGTFRNHWEPLGTFGNHWRPGFSGFDLFFCKLAIREAAINYTPRKK